MLSVANLGVSYAEYHYCVCCLCWILFLLSVAIQTIMPSVMLADAILSVVMLGAIKLNVI